MAIKSNISARAVTTELKLPSAGITYSSTYPDFPETVVITPYSLRTESVLTSNLTASVKMMEIVRAVASFGEIKNFDYRDLLISDQYFILAVARALTYGESYLFPTQCPMCGNIENIEILVPKTLPVRVWNKSEPPRLEVSLPDSKDVVQFRYHTVKDDEAVRSYVRQLIGNKYSELEAEAAGDVRRMAQQIVSVNGGSPDNIGEAEAYVSAIRGKDLVALSDAIDEKASGIVYRWKVVCDKCKHHYERRIPLTGDFFRRNQV